MFKSFIAILLALTSVAAIADEDNKPLDEVVAYGIHIGSKHFPQYNYNNVNPGVYVRMKSGMTYGTYFNSERRTSVYAGYTYEFNDRFAVTVGLVSGYSLGKEKTRIYPMIVPSMKLGKIADTTFRLAIMPQASSKNFGSTALHLTAEW